MKLVILAFLVVAVSAELFDNLYRDLHARQVPKTIPQTSADAPLNVTVNLTPVFIVSLDTVTGIAKIRAWLLRQWTDERLAWKPSCYNDLNKVAYNPHDIWVPDVMLFRGETDSLETEVIMKSNGEVIYIPQYTYTVQCDVNDYKVNGTVTCELKFGSWVRSGKQIDVHSPVPDTSVFQEGQWALANLTSARLEKKYACCPEVYVSIVYTMTLQDVHH